MPLHSCLSFFIAQAKPLGCRPHDDELVLFAAIDEAEHILRLGGGDEDSRIAKELVDPREPACCIQIRCPTKATDLASTTTPCNSSIDRKGAGSWQWRTGRTKFHRISKPEHGFDHFQVPIMVVGPGSGIRHN